jgi:hypothetical protein
MNTVALRACAEVILECSIEQYLPLKNLNAKLLYPFRAELEENLVPLETQKSREKVIYYYISQFDQHTVRINDICYNNLTPEEKSVKIANSFSELEDQIPGISQAKISHYITHYFINQLFDYIQKACIYYGINFLQLCKTLGFPIDCINYLNPGFIIEDKYLPLIEKIFTHCNSVIFDCDYDLFCQCIRNADFRPIKIKTGSKSRARDLIYRLSGIIEEPWYTEVCRIMHSKKPVYSGKKETYAEETWMKELDNMLPRPRKRTRTNPEI